MFLEGNREIEGKEREKERECTGETRALVRDKRRRRRGNESKKER